uniref:GGDEF domain-containing protein n=1 Tax=candidate division WOR-3 bacterium TaxID=2052148 RepID=A0A7C3J6E0_UNCW3
MGYNIEKIREKFDADFVFSNENDMIQKTGIVGYTDDVVKQVIVVLKQSLDAANVSKVDKIEFQNEDKKIIFFHKKGSFFGLIVNKNVIVDDIDFAEIVEKEFIKEEKEDKVKIALKDKKKIVVKPSQPVKEEVKEKIVEKEETVSTLNIDGDSFNKIKKIAGEFLEDFAEDIINNIVSEMKLDIKNLSQSKLDEFLKRFSKASSMIIGPSQSQKMVEKILQSMK